MPTSYTCYLLENGASIASMIAKRLGIKRVTVYAALDTLNKKQLISSFQKNNVTYFESVSPEEIVNICHKKITEDMELERLHQKTSTSRDECPKPF